MDAWISTSCAKSIKEEFGMYKKESIIKGKRQDVYETCIY